MRPLVWLDLCSGLGGASQPALDRGWKVIRLDVDSHFKPDICADVRALPLKPFHVDVLWASPPCQEFSKRCLPWFRNKPPLPEPNLEIAYAIRKFILSLFMPYWFVENVWCARKWFNGIFGAPRIRVPGHCIWSNLQVLVPNIAPHKGSLGRVNGSGRWGPRRGQWRNSAQIAKIPYEIGEAICRAVEKRAASDKQLGGNPTHDIEIDYAHIARDVRMSLTAPGERSDSRGADPAEWPEDLRVREFPHE